MKNVCRTILLHDEFIPAMAGKRNWKYQVLGHHDGMSVGNAAHLDGGDLFEGIFRVNAEYESRKADYSTQYFYGFHFDEGKEEQFWNVETPFVFVAFLQFDGRNIREYQRYLESEQYIQSEKREEGSENGGRIIYTLAYFAMDSSDIILVIKCNRCEDGAAMINHLHHDPRKIHPFTLRSSYSVLALDRQYVEDPLKTEQVEGNIDLLELRIIERKGGSIDGLYYQLCDSITSRSPKSQVERKALLGTEDEAIIIKNLPWKYLLFLYREETGILCNSNECTKAFANAISAKMFYLIEEYEESADDSGWPSDNSALLCDYLYDEIVALYESKETNNDLTEHKNLIMLVNAFRKVENSWHNGAAFLDYIFFTMLFPFAIFVILHETNYTNQHEYYKFINRLRLGTQNFTKPNRVFSQVADFNIRYFDIPSKLLAFYNAYIYQVKDLLNTRTDRQYEFLVSLGLNNKTAVEEIYARTLDKIHLFIVEIPEAQMYMMKLMLITLGHEVSHFVGTDLRKRDKRFESIIKISGHMAILAIRDYIKYVNVFEEECLLDEDLWKVVEENLRDELAYCLMRHQNTKYLKGTYFAQDELTEKQLDNQTQFYQTYFQHTEVLKKILFTALNDILDVDVDLLFEDIIWKSFEAAIKNKKVKYEERDTYYTEHKGVLSRCIDAFRGKRGEKTDYLTINNGIEYVMCLMEECYADLICILSLELSLKDYLCSFIGTLDSSGLDMGDIYDKVMIARIAIVLSVLNYDMKGRGKKENDFRWLDDEIVKLNDNKRAFDLYITAEEFTNCCINGQVPISPEERIRNAQAIICDREILREIIKYLLRCREGYSQLVELEKKSRVKRLFLLSQESDMGEFFSGISSVLDEYEKRVYEDIPKWIERDKNRQRK